jgi:hypothetical protein
VARASLFRQRGVTRDRQPLACGRTADRYRGWCKGARLRYGVHRVRSPRRQRLRSRSRGSRSPLGTSAGCPRPSPGFRGEEARSRRTCATGRGRLVSTNPAPSTLGATAVEKHRLSPADSDPCAARERRPALVRLPQHPSPSRMRTRHRSVSATERKSERVPPAQMCTTGTAPAKSVKSWSCVQTSVWLTRAVAAIQVSWMRGLRSAARLRAASSA